MGTSSDLKNHILYEFYAGLPNKENILNESRGVVSGLHEVVNAICNDMVKDILKTVSKKGATTKIYSGKVSNYGLTSFFDEYMIAVKVSYGEKTTYSGGLWMRESFLDSADGVVCHPHIDIEITGKDPSTIINTVSFAIGHELTHAYNEFKYARKNGLKASDIVSNFIEVQGQSRIAASKKSQIQNEKAIGNFLYLANRMERNAYIAQLKQELETKKNEIEDSKSAWEAVLGTESYKKFKMLERVYRQMLSEELTAETKKQIISYTNKITGRKFNSYGQVKKFCINLWEKWRKKYLTMASKIVYDIFAENNPMTDGDMTNTDVLLTN